MMTETVAIRADLDRLNEAVDEAVRQRTAFLDSAMARVAKYPIGAELYELRTGRYLGRVVAHYRFWAGRDERYDRSLDIDYRFDNGSNTSSQMLFEDSIGTQEEAWGHGAMPRCLTPVPIW